MNPVLKIVTCFIDAFIISVAVSLPFDLDIYKILLYCSAVGLAIVLRIMLDKLFKPKDILRVISITLPWCFIASAIWFEFLDYKKGFIVYLFVNALFSEFMASESQKGFREGFRKRADYLGSWIAGNIPPKEPAPKDQEEKS